MNHKTPFMVHVLDVLGGLIIFLGLVGLLGVTLASAPLFARLEGPNSIFARVLGGGVVWGLAGALFEAILTGLFFVALARVIDLLASISHRQGLLLRAAQRQNFATDLSRQQSREPIPHAKSTRRKAGYSKIKIHKRTLGV